MNKEQFVDLLNFLNTKEFEKILFKENSFDLYFKSKGKEIEDTTALLKLVGLSCDVNGLIITCARTSDDKNLKIFSGLKNLYSFAYEFGIPVGKSLLIIDIKGGGDFFYDHLQNEEWAYDSGELESSSFYHNLSLYISLLKIFRTTRSLTEFDDEIVSTLLIVDNGKDKNLANISYQLFDDRINTKKVSFDLEELKKWLEFNTKPNHLEWISCFKHNVVFLLNSQIEENKTFTELFLNINFILANTIRDYEIFMSGFSFEKISRELKDEKKKYFDDLNQAQDKIKSQVIAVPLSIGTSIYAFFQLNTDVRTYYFIIAMVGIYIFFIWWYLHLYDKDLHKLKSEIEEETDKFETIYPKVYEIFKPDFVYIRKKVNSVLILSRVIKLTILIDWIVLFAYVYFVIKNPVAIPERPYFRFL